MKFTTMVLAGLLAITATAQDKIQLTADEKLSIRELQLAISESNAQALQAQMQFETARKTGEEARQKLTQKLKEAQKSHKCEDCQWSQDGTLVLVRPAPEKEKSK